jgi:osmotically inducible protein OsmC
MLSDKGAAMKVQKQGSAAWQGTLKEGKGTISTQSGALSAIPYGFKTRFEGVTGTNPEELLGATHASCFTMALSMILGEAGFTADSLETKANVTLEKVGDGFEITAIQLMLRGTVPGIDQAKFQELANKAKVGCPISKVLKAPITLEAQLTVK